MITVNCYQTEYSKLQIDSPKDTVVLKLNEE